MLLFPIYIALAFVITIILTIVAALTKRDEFEVIIFLCGVIGLLISGWIIY